MGAVIVATVPKTGSNFMVKAVRARPNLTGSAEEFIKRAEKGDGCVMFRHTLEIHGGFQELSEIPKGLAPVITPMRHPLTVAKSWAKQGTPWPWGGPGAFVAAFDNLFSMNPFVVPLDLESFEARLAEAGRLTDREIDPDRSPENVNGAIVRALSREEMAAVDTVLARHADVLAGLGYALAEAA